MHGHFLPQHYYAYNGTTGERIVTRVLRFENLTAEFDALMEEYGLPIRLPERGKASFHAYNRRKGHKPKKKMGVEDLSADTVKAINDAYALDFSYFGYRMIEAG